MKRLQLPKNKFLKLIINVVLIVAWYSIYSLWAWELMLSGNDFVLQDLLGYELYWILLFLIIFIPIFFITRYIWFEKSRNRIFYGLFNKFKFPNLEPRIYTNTSNADDVVYILSLSFMFLFQKYQVTKIIGKNIIIA